MRLFSKKIQSGFTLLEMIFSMGILMILIGILTTVFVQILDVQLESKSVSSVDQNGRFILARLAYDMEHATAIVTPASPGVTSDTLHIRVNSVDYIYSASPSGNFVLSNANGIDMLNNYAASVSAVSFTRVGNGDSNDTIRMNFTITSRIRDAKGFDQKSFQTTFGLD